MERKIKKHLFETIHHGEAKKTYKFEDLVFNQHPYVPEEGGFAVHAFMEFPNGHYISVIGGDRPLTTFNGDGKKRFEVRIDKDEPIGWRTKNEVTELMVDTQKLPPLVTEARLKRPFKKPLEIPELINFGSGTDWVFENDSEEYQLIDKLSQNQDWLENYLDTMSRNGVTVQYDPMCDTYIIGNPYGIEDEEDLNEARLKRNIRRIYQDEITILQFIQELDNFSNKDIPLYVSTFMFENEPVVEIFTDYYKDYRELFIYNTIDEGEQLDSEPITIREIIKQLSLGENILEKKVEILYGDNDDNQGSWVTNFEFRDNKLIINK